ncbi:transmembrane protein 205 [Brachionichthys hirsutus]|uniref:transmembrane protein 205 n=1 Tax=Brachionichthys hirsutus TaxID=412623 RepID=UPI003604E0D6
MVTEGQPGDLIKVLHLLMLSFSWGMQAWVSFIAGFVLIQQVSRHTFGVVQSKLFPAYFYCLIGSNLCNLAIYAACHPRDLQDRDQSVQMLLYFVALITACLNSQWFGPSINKLMHQKGKAEREHGLGSHVGLFIPSKGYDKLKEQDPKYRADKLKFDIYHRVSILCNLVGFIGTTINLIYAALNLSTI